MTDRDESTERFVAEHPLTRDTRRIALCVAACEGIDNSMLKLLAEKRGGMTSLQYILSKVSWTNLPTQ